MNVDVQQVDNLIDTLIDTASADAASTPTSVDGPRPSVANGSGDPPERNNGDEDVGMI